MNRFVSLSAARRAVLAACSVVAVVAVTGCAHPISITPKADAAVRFAAKVARERGPGEDDAVRLVKLAGYDDAQIVEIVLHVALNTWTNYLNEVARTVVDFPAVTPAHAA